MFFFEGNEPKVFVTYGSGSSGWTGSGRWEVYPSTWKEGDPDFTCAQEKAYPEQPIRGFGEVWCNYPQVRQGLGWGVDRMRDQDYQKAIELLEKVIEQSPGVTESPRHEVQRLKTED